MFRFVRRSLSITPKVAIMHFVPPAATRSGFARRWLHLGEDGSLKIDHDGLSRATSAAMAELPDLDQGLLIAEQRSAFKYAVCVFRKLLLCHGKISASVSLISHDFHQRALP